MVANLISYRRKEKSIVCAFFFVVPLIVGLLVPYFLLRESIYRHRINSLDFEAFRSQSTLSVKSGSMPGWFSPVSSISTGLLFGVSLLHLIPDCTTDMQNALERNGFELKLISKHVECTGVSQWCARWCAWKLNLLKCKC